MKILVVEDDALTAEALVATLANQNYSIETAVDGEAGWDLTEAFAYDLILLDVTLPKLDGISLCQRLRSQGYQMPILLLTARNSSHDKAIGLDAGADDYVVKPFDPEELAARIRALLRRNQGMSQSVLEWGDLQLNPSSCEVRYGDKLLSLTAKEYALLELFLRSSRRVFSCGAILENLWSFDDIPSDEAVRTHIKGLRQKLKAAGAAPDLIETVYGIGYRLKQKEQKEKGPKGDRKASYEPSQNSLSSATTSTQQQTLALVSKVWHRFKERVSEQVRVIERAVVALQQQELDQELQQQAKREAHTLAGSLGTFGLSQGSALARQIEHALKAEQGLSQDEMTHLQDWVRLLRQEIERPDQVSQGASNHTTEPKATSTNATTSQGADLGLHQADRAKAGVMVVDDDPKMLAIVRSLLEPWGLKVTTLANPQQFWEVLEAASPDLLILDIEMPEISGVELCQTVRNDSRWSGLPILFLTAHTDSESVNQVFSVGADDFVSKPILGPELVTRIINRLERIRFLQNLAQTDPLTKVATRQKATQDLHKFLRLAKRQEQPFCLAILELDQFEQLSDRSSSPLRDEVLRHVGEVLRNSFDFEDVVARWSENEFVIGVYGISKQDGVQRLHKMMEVLHQQSFTSPQSLPNSFRVTFSAGVAECPGDGNDLTALYQAANTALRQAKTIGEGQLMPV